jgi:hypothetical protein
LNLIFFPKIYRTDVSRQRLMNIGRP